MYPLGPTYSATQSAVWHAITIDVAQANSSIIVVATNRNQTSTFGVRSFGSTDDDKAQYGEKIEVDAVVSTNGSKQIEVYTDDISNTQFFFSSQM